MKLSHIFSQIKNAHIIGPDLSITGIALDSREVKENDLFCALLGADTDGRYFIQEALSKGAIAIVTDSALNLDLGVTLVVLPELRENLGKVAAAFYENPSLSMPVIAVTGTNGKTSVCDYIRQFSELLSVPVAAIGTLGVRYKDELTPLMNTTPDVLSTNAILSDLLKRDCQRVAMEVSSHGLVQRRVNALQFDTAVFTNLSQDHLDYHGDMESYAQAKSLLFTQSNLKTCVVNIDDPAAKYMLEKVSVKNVNTIRYSLKNTKAEAYFSEIRILNQGYRGLLHIAGEIHPFKTSLVGEFNLYNLLAAILVIYYQGGTMLSDLIARCSDIKPVTGRVESVPNAYGLSAIVDYAHTPDALDRLLSTLKMNKAKNLYVVFGCGGDRDKAKRPLMGAIAEKYADFCWVTSDNPRSESPIGICNEITEGMSDDAYDIIIDRKEAIQQALRRVTKQDIVVVAGKGHEKYQLINGNYTAFDDVDVIKHAIEARGRSV